MLVWSLRLPSLKILRQKLLRKLLHKLLQRRLVLLAFIIDNYSSHIIYTGLILLFTTSRVRVVAQSFFAPIHMSFTYFPLSNPLTGRHFSQSVLRVRYIYSCNENSNELLKLSLIKIFRRAIAIRNRRFIYQSPPPTLLAFGVVCRLNLQVCTPKVVCSFV